MDIAKGLVGSAKCSSGITEGSADVVGYSTATTDSTATEGTINGSTTMGVSIAEVTKESAEEGRATSKDSTTTNGGTADTLGSANIPEVSFAEFPEPVARMSRISTSSAPTNEGSTDPECPADVEGSAVTLCSAKIAEVLFAEFPESVAGLSSISICIPTSSSARRPLSWMNDPMNDWLSGNIPPSPLKAM